MRRLGVALLSLVAFVALVAGLLTLVGYRLNVSPSIPLGLYQLTGVPPQRGNYVALCPPDTADFRQAVERNYVPAGFCPSGSTMLLKVLAGVAGDHLTLSADGVTINGALWPDSAPAEHDGAGRPLAAAVLPDVIPRGDVLLMSEHETQGWDGRYFGTVPEVAIVGPIERVVTW